ncbi:metal ABC transporter permease [Oceanicella actignis]|uniref:Manganese/zinc/iron transport system permease protein n=1 Tax=Oceanicella actignis TaxID=1189325 RepID=A0A1M7TXL7_9RHOB|nr:metal ABC transporter permease [Oceanicella actignis]SET80638.1 manganese/zinc/iron transport system permease protein [Oceanicella actignis]SHN75502.1 manganese/zinc/iron transport system permease protein [Oceanicella actignis]
MIDSLIAEISSPEFVQLSLPPMVIGALAAMSCALPGNFLLLRRQSMLADAVSHVALPGIVAAFLLTGSMAGGTMMLGAGAAALVAAGMIEAVRRVGRLEPGAAMGVVFTAMFALGVLMLERTGASGVHLDVEHALYGNLESLIWFDATGWSSAADPRALAGLPAPLWRLAAALAAMAALTRLFWKELTISTFDPGHAQVIGVPVRALSLGLTGATAAAAVAAFDAVGSILVIAMFICPPAAARLCANTLSRQVWLSMLFAALSALVGYVLAGYGPLWLGARGSVSAAGMIAVVSGLILALACVAGPARRRAGGALGAEGR